LLTPNASTDTIDCRREDREKRWQIKRQNWCLLIDLDYLSENSDHYPKQEPVQPRDAFEDTTFKQAFEIVKF
jgi:hypothetical protein